MSTESVMASNHLILCCPLLLLPSIFPRIRVFSNESALRTWWPKYWSFSFIISPSNEYSGLTSLKIDWFDLLAVWETFRSLSSTRVLRNQFFVILPSLQSSRRNGKPPQCICCENLINCIKGQKKWPYCYLIIQKGSIHFLWN